jgi:mRNA interferase MazF
MPVVRGEIYFVNLDPVHGKEMDGNKARPVVVLSINFINNKRLVVTVVPGTTAGNKPRHFRNVVSVPPTPGNGLSVGTIFQCHQIRTIDHGRFTSPPVGRISSQHLWQIEDAVKYRLGLFDR